MPPRVQRLQGVSFPHRSLSQTPRLIHSSIRRNVAIPTATSSSETEIPRPSQLLVAPSTRTPRKPATLARLPTSVVLRSYLITRMSSSPTLLSLCFIILRQMLNSKSYLMSIERNPILAKVLKSTFYAQYCAGEDAKEVQLKTAAAKRDLGYGGIILEYSLEVLGGAKPTEAETAQEIEVWKKGMLASIEAASPGDFIGLKWSGLGRHALDLLQRQQAATPAIWSAILEACDAAAAKRVCVLPGAEEEVTNPGLEKWNIELQKKYNTPERGYAVVYTTYQCYLKAISKRLAHHLDTARREGYIAGVKLVRGAYLATEPRNLIWETQEGTNTCYDACADAVLRGKWNEFVPGDVTAPFPSVNIILATHNLASVRKAQAIRAAQMLSSAPARLPRLAYAQLQGMADEISQDLVQDENQKADVNARVVKLMAWGTTTECLHYLLRRASENKEAAMRVDDTRRAMAAELWRRMKGGFGLT